jgi:hypothetical protein
MSKVVKTEFTYTSLVDFAINRPHRAKSDRTSSRDGRPAFSGTDSFEQAVEYAKTGWDVGLEKFKLEDVVTASGMIELQPRVQGFLPHIPNYINGFPEQMFHLEDVKDYNLPEINIYAPLNYNSFIKADQAIEYAKSLARIVNQLSASHKVKLIGISCTQMYSGTKYIDQVVIKDYDESLVINCVAFAFHPSFLRRLIFSVLESREDLDSGYGSTITWYKPYLELDNIPSNSLFVNNIMRIVDAGLDLNFDYEKSARYCV